MLHEISFKSFNERDEVQGWIYVPACEPKGIIQLIHNYDEIKAEVEKGIIDFFMNL